MSISHRIAIAVPGEGE